jgi:hypothetical protein
VGPVAESLVWAEELLSAGEDLAPCEGTSPPFPMKSVRDGCCARAMHELF